MKLISIVEIGNHKSLLTKRVIDFIQAQQIQIKTLFEKSLSIKNIELEATEAEEVPASLYTCHFSIGELGTLSASLSCRGIDNIFCRHLNIPTWVSDDILNYEKLTFSHVNFFHRQVISLLEILFPKIKVDLLKSETTQQTSIDINLSLVANECQEELYISFSNELLDYFSDGLKKQKDFNVHDVQHQLNDIPFNINVVLMKSELSINDVNAIAVGDFIELQKYDLLDVNVENQTLFKGQLIVGENAQLGVKYA